MILNKLRSINDSLIMLNKDNDKELEKQKLIKKILNRDDCFLRMDVEVAFALLASLQIKKDLIEDVYLELID